MIKWGNNLILALVLWEVVTVSSSSGKEKIDEPWEGLIKWRMKAIIMKVRVQEQAEYKKEVLYF